MKTCPGVRTGEMVDLRGTPLYYFEELFLEKNDLDPVGVAHEWGRGTGFGCP